MANRVLELMNSYYRNLEISFVTNKHAILSYMSL